MAEDQGPVVERALLRNELMRLRREAGKTQREMAAALEWSEATMIRVEGGKTIPTKANLEALLKEYGITDKVQTEVFLSLQRGARRQAWWDDYRDMPEDYLKYVGYEAGAHSIRHTQNAIIPGLLQTREYAQVVTSEFLPTERVARTVELRMRRQKELRRRGRSRQPKEVYILDEAVIRRRVGVSVDRGLMPAQLYHLIELSEHDDISIHIIPFEKGFHFGLRGPFTILGFQALDDVVYLEGAGAAQLREGGDSIAEYNDAFFSLLEGDEGKESAVLGPAESQLLIRRTAEGMLAQA